MKQHYSEADLLETYYTRPGESMPVMMHLAECEDCAAHYDRLESKMRGLRACAHDQEKPETFWIRQRIAVMRKIEARRARRGAISRITKVAAAAMLVLLLGALVTWRQGSDPAIPPRVETVVSQTAPLEDATGRSLGSSSSSSDPWQSDELKDYSSMVDWESWVENGDPS